MRNDLKTMPIYMPPAKELMNLGNNENFYIEWNTLLKDDLYRLTDAVNLHQYGTSSHDELLEKYAQYSNVDSTQLLVAPGSDTLIPLVVNALTDNKILTLGTDFFRYPQAAAIMKRENIRVPLGDNCYDEIIEIANSQDIELIMLSNPNNPLGIIHKREDLIKLLDETDCYVVVDEAYAEYQGETLMDLIDTYDKLIILKTLSKAWGLAGLRVGFAVTNSELILFLKAAQGPFVLNDLSGQIAAKALDHVDLVKAQIAQTNQEKDLFVDFLQQFELDEIYESHANFVYIKVDNAKEILEALKQAKIAVAFFNPDGLRITVGNSEQMDYLKNSLKTILKPRV